MPSLRHLRPAGVLLALSGWTVQATAASAVTVGLGGEHRPPLVPPLLAAALLLAPCEPRGLTLKPFCLSVVQHGMCGLSTGVQLAPPTPGMLALKAWR